MSHVKISLHTRLVAGFALCVLLMIVLAGIDFNTMGRLERLYQETYRRSIDTELATDAQNIGADLYLVIANAVINRRLEKSQKEWSAAKAACADKLRRLALAADGVEERAMVTDASRAYYVIVGIYETELLPLIVKGKAVSGPVVDIDAQIDVQIDSIDRSLQLLARMLSAENARAAQEFHALLVKSTYLGLGISLFGVIAALSISALTGRHIFRPLSEVTRAAHEMERGNYLYELRYHSNDEAGVLANAFRAMARQVVNHTRELEGANDRLNSEIVERRLAEEEVIRLNADLELRVAERTAELQRLNEQCLTVIEAQKKAQAELKQSRQELRNLSRHLQNAREDERSAIAREIHDELGQLLTAFKMDVSWLKGKLGTDQEQLLQKTKEMLQHIDLTIGTVQRISAELRPGILDDLGITSAIEWQAQEFQKRTGIRCAVVGSFDGTLLDRGRCTTLFRIVQEALTNIYRHAGATEAIITLTENDDSVEASVADNGAGVPQDKINHAGSLGFIGMRERVSFFGGDVTIGCGESGGTCVRVTVPIGEAEDDVEEAAAETPAP